VAAEERVGDGKTTPGSSLTTLLATGGAEAVGNAPGESGAGDGDGDERWSGKTGVEEGGGERMTELDCGINGGGRSDMDMGMEMLLGGFDESGGSGAVIDDDEGATAGERGGGVGRMDGDLDAERGGAGTGGERSCALCRLWWDELSPLLEAVDRMSGDALRDCSLLSCDMLLRFRS